MLAYHNDPQLKATVLSLLAEHREADRLVKGKYWEGGKGCAVGCTLESIRVLRGQKTILHDNHALYESYLGVPRVLAKLEDELFESLPNGEAQAWPERFAQAIAPGADLSMVWPKFLHNLLTDPAGGVQIGARERPESLAAIQAVADLFGRWIDGAMPSREEWLKARADADAAYAYASAYASAYAASAAADAYASADAASASAYAAAADAYASAAAAAAAERRRQANVLITLLETASPASTET